MKAHEMFLNSIENKEQFWAEQADQIHWFKNLKRFFLKEKTTILYGFADGELNACYLAIDKHIEDGYGDQVAYIYDSLLHGYETENYF